MSEFTVSGTFRARDGPQGFERTVEAPNEAVARERVYAGFGAEHGLKRRDVDIQEVEE